MARWIIFGAALAASYLAVPIVLWLTRLLGVYTTVQEGRTKIFVLFGNVVKILDRPGLHIFPFGLSGVLVGLFGQTYVVDMRLDQCYLRAQPVNSKEGAPMAIGVWLERQVVNARDYQFKNVDPEASLNANVSSSAVERLSNLPLELMLRDRHAMSKTVRETVSPIASQYGMRVGSVYIRKVDFRDTEMMRQIVRKVVTKLTQVIAAIRQGGENQVGVITSTAKATAAAELAKADTIRPEVVGKTLAEIGEDPDVLNALMEILNIKALKESPAELVLVPKEASVLIGRQS